jgi:hypothetical protein
MATGTHIDLGYAMITMVEPTQDPERLREYNRWYEHDHCYSGVMVGPGAFSYGRFAATRALKDVRLSASPTVADPIDQGSFIAFYWYLAGTIDEHFAWSFPATQALAAAGRMNTDRTHISTSLYDFRGSVNRPGWPVPAEVALDHRYAGVVGFWLDRTENTTSDQLVDWLMNALPNALANDSALAQALVFTPRDFPGVANSGVGVGDRVLVALFTQTNPLECWQREVTAVANTISSSGLATLGLVAPFVGVIPGTETYLDQLW